MRCIKCGYHLESDTDICPVCKMPCTNKRTFFDHLAKIEEFFLSIFLGVMILIVLVQIFLRNFYSSDISGGSEIVRHLVLWVAFLGAGLATRDRMHIRIDLAYRVLPVRLTQFFEMITGIFSVFICSILVYASINFVYMDFNGLGTIDFLKTPVWILELIIPIGYLIVTLRYAARSTLIAWQIIRGE